MPEQDLADFAEYWNLSMFDDSGSPRIPGGLVDEGGVDYGKYLIPWCKGNSVSVDQTTLRHPRDLVSMLVENYRSDIYRRDSNTKKHLDHRCGVTFDDLIRMFGKPLGKGRRGVGTLSFDWVRIERILGQMLLFGDIAILSHSSASPGGPKDMQRGFRNTLHRDQSKIINNIRTRGSLANSWDEMEICRALEESRDTFGYVRLSEKKGWDLYIRDHYGAPSGVEGAVPGNMAGMSPPGRASTMPLPLHLVYAETMARVMARDGNPWGKNQSIIRREISDAVIDGNGVSLPLDDFYLIHSRNSASHMADHTFQRSIGDLASATYQLEEVTNSDPRSWVVKIDPDLIRWRENRRERDRERDAQ